MNIQMNILNTDLTSKTIHIELVGKIDETSKFNKLMPDFSPYNHIFINCHKVSKINSTGVKQWITYFKSLTSNNKVLIFQSLSPFLVEQRNLMPDFLAYGLLESIEVPFKCKEKSCNKDFNMTVDADTLLPKINFETDEIDAHPSCPHCGSNNTYFDDLADEYFRFLHTSDKKVA